MAFELAKMIASVCAFVWSVVCILHLEMNVCTGSDQLDASSLCSCYFKHTVTHHWESCEAEMCPIYLSQNFFFFFLCFNVCFKADMAYWCISNFNNYEELIHQNLLFQKTIANNLFYAPAAISEHIYAFVPSHNKSHTCISSHGQTHLNSHS